jgi:anti-sigma B factor antagonist
MSLSLSSRQVGDVTVVQVSGRVVLGDEMGAFRDVLRDLVNRGQTRILLNLKDVTYIDSSGVGELVAAFTTIRTRGGTMKLTSLTRKLEDLLMVTKLYAIFDVRDDEDAAIHSFR